MAYDTLHIASRPHAAISAVVVPCSAQDLTACHYAIYTYSYYYAEAGRFTSLSFGDAHASCDLA